MSNILGINKSKRRTEIPAPKFVKFPLSTVY